MVLSETRFIVNAFLIFKGSSAVSVHVWNFAVRLKRHHMLLQDYLHCHEGANITEINLLLKKSYLLKLTETDAQSILQFNGLSVIILLLTCSNV